MCLEKGPVRAWFGTGFLKGAWEGPDSIPKCLLRDFSNLLELLFM